MALKRPESVIARRGVASRVSLTKKPNALLFACTRTGAIEPSAMSIMKPGPA